MRMFGVSISEELCKKLEAIDKQSCAISLRQWLLDDFEATFDLEDRKIFVTKQK